MKNKFMATHDLKMRTKEYALRIIKLVQALPNNQIGWVIGKQLLRCGTSVGANYRSACRGRSKAEFVAKLGIVIEDGKLVQPLLKEANEIVAIMVSSSHTAKKHKQ